MVLHTVGVAVRSEDLAAVWGHRHAGWGDADGDCGGHRIHRCSNHRYHFARDIDLAAVGADRDAEGGDADRDCGDHRIRRRVDDRHCVGDLVYPRPRDVGVLREAFRRDTEKAREGKGREQPGNAKIHGILPDTGSGPAASAKGLIRRFNQDNIGSLVRGNRESLVNDRNSSSDGLPAASSDFFIDAV